MNKALNLKDNSTAQKATISEYTFGIILIVMWGRYWITNYARGVLAKLPAVYMIAPYVFPAITLFCVVACLPQMKKLKFIDVFLPFLLLLFYLFTILFYPENTEYLKEQFVNLFLVYIPLYYVGLNLNVRKYIKLFCWISLLNVWAGLFYTLFIRQDLSSTQSIFSGDMGTAYYILPHVCTVIFFALKKPNWYTIPTAAVAFVFLFICGTRGAMLAALVFTILYIIFFRKYKKPALAYTFILSGSACLIVFFNKLLSIIETIALRFGRSVRIIEKIKKGNIFGSSGRDVLWKSMLDLIKKRPLLGYGVGGDDAQMGIYAHNIVLEFWISFGIVIGTILLAWLGVTIIKGLHKAEPDIERPFVLLLACCIFIHLMLSQTYLNETYFFLLIGLCTQLCRRKPVFLSDEAIEQSKTGASDPHE